MRLDRILFRLLTFPSPPGGEGVVSSFCAGFLAGCGFDVKVDRLGNVAAKRGNGPFILLVAHLDDWGHPKKRGFRVLPGGLVVSATGSPLGGDDKCGVALALSLACDPRRPLAVLLTVQEESGGLGCREFVRENTEWFADVSACLVLDRRGEGDVVARIGTHILDPGGSFRRRVMEAGAAEGVPVRLVDGAFSDVLTLRLLTGLPAANISVGYHLPHTAGEYVSLPHLRRARRWVRRVLDTARGV